MASLSETELDAASYQVSQAATHLCYVIAVRRQRFASYGASGPSEQLAAALARLEAAMQRFNALAHGQLEDLQPTAGPASVEKVGEATPPGN